MDPAARPSTRIGPNYTIAINVSVQSIDERELCRNVQVDPKGLIELTVGARLMEKFSIAGMTCAQAQQRITAALRRYFAGELEVKVGIARMTRFQVLVSGATQKAGIVDLPDGARLSDLLADVNYLANADLGRIVVARYENGSRNRILADMQQLAGGTGGPANDPVLRNGDAIYVDTVIVPETPKYVAVVGEVKREGTVPYRKGMTVKDALEGAFGLLPTAERERVTIRRTSDNTIQTVNADFAIKDVPTDNVKLAPDDTVIVGRHDSGLKYSIVGAVVAPQTFDYKGPVTLSQAIVDAGGFRPEADRANIVVIQAMLKDPANTKNIPVNFDKLRKGEMGDPILQPGDMVQVPQKKKTKLNFLDLGIMLLRTFLF